MNNILKLLKNISGINSGVVESRLPGVRIFKETKPIACRPMLYNPGICIIASGHKIGHLAGQSFRYDADNYLVTSVAMAFSNAILGAVHSMAHKTGRILDIAHGRANAIYLTYVTQFNAKTAPQKYAEIAKYIGLSGKNDEEQVSLLLGRIKKLRSDLSMPSSLKEFGTDEKAFLSQLPELAKAAVADPCTGTNPRPVSEEEMVKLFKAVYYGAEVTF